MQAGCRKCAIITLFRECRQGVGRVFLCTTVQGVGRVLLLQLPLARVTFPDGDLTEQHAVLITKAKLTSAFA